MRGEIVTVLTAGQIHSDYSDSDVEDWDNPTERDVMTLAPAEPRPMYRTDEPVLDARNTLTSGFTLFLPPNDPITPKDRVRVRGKVYPVRGNAARWRTGVIVQVFSMEDE